MPIMCLTLNTWNGKARSVIQMTPCCPPPIHTWVGEQSKSLGCWCASCLLSWLSCLSSICWAVNRFLRISLDLFWHRLRSSESSTSASITCNGIMSVLCRINPYIVNLLRTYLHACIHTYKHAYIHTYVHKYIQAQPQTKTTLAPVAPARLWASR